MKQKILRLAKRLNNFTVDDIAILSGIESEQAEKLLDELVLDNRLKKNDFNYLYIDTIIINKAITIDKTTNSTLENHLYTGIQDYFNISRASRNTVDKYLKVLDYTNGLSGQQLEAALKEWNNNNPNETVSLKSLCKARQLLNTKGIQGLLQKAKTSAKREYPEELFLYFKDFYMSPQKLPSQKAYQMAIEKYKETHSRFDESMLPNSNAFYKRIQRFYTK